MVPGAVRWSGPQIIPIACGFCGILWALSNLPDNCPLTNDLPPGRRRASFAQPASDIQLNLQGPLSGTADQLAALGLPPIATRAWARTGDTPQSERERMRRLPPHILVTTPESLYILLTSSSGRELLGTARTVILDEIHALAGNKRGAYLALSLERLEALAGGAVAAHRNLRDPGLGDGHGPLSPRHPRARRMW